MDKKQESECGEKGSKTVCGHCKDQGYINTKFGPQFCPICNKKQ